MIDSLCDKAFTMQVKKYVNETITKLIVIELVSIIMRRSASLLTKITSNYVIFDNYLKLVWTNLTIQVLNIC